MPPEKILFCDDCSGRWNCAEFWHSCPSDTEASQQTWGHVHLRKFGEIERTRQCSFCRLIYNALTKRGRRPISKDTAIYFSKSLFAEYESRSTDPLDHGTASQFSGLEKPAWQRHIVNRLCVSTFPSRTNLGRDELRLFRDEIRCGSFYECHIARLREDADSYRFFHGRRMTSTFDTSLVERWIKECDNAHSSECSLSRVVKRPSRIINIKEKRIQYTPPSCSYVTLSYRWPTSAGLKLTSTTEELLMENGGLAHVDGILPIVEDAMTLLTILGWTYLWVDALCIPQQEKDPQGRLDEERKEQLEAMTDTYHGADFTIIACSDPNSNKGLPGIRNCTRPSQSNKDMGQYSFAVTKPDLFDAGENSEWNSRVWTFQEAALSRRLLVFTDHQVFFHCNGAIWCEDTFLETPELQEIRIIDHPSSKAPYWRNRFPEQPLEFPEWVDVVQNYTTRTATRETDYPRGLEFIKLKNRAFCCLPEKYFALALCFVASRGEQRTLNSSTWCWCHWKVPDGVTYLLEAPFFQETAEKLLSITFYKVVRDLQGHSLLPIRMDDAQHPSLANAMEIPSIRSRFEITNHVAFRTLVCKGRLSLGKKKFEENCDIQFPFLDNARASAVLALDCGKNEGDLVTCAEVLLDYEANEAWFLVVETNTDDISHRIGTATINLIDWNLATNDFEATWLFLE